MNDSYIKEKMHELLDEEKTSVTFESVWEKSRVVDTNALNTNPSRVKLVKLKQLKLLIAATIALSISIFVVADAMLRLDDVSYRFIEDKNVLGSWVAVDFVESIECFNPYKPPMRPENFYFQASVFGENGRMTYLFYHSDVNEVFAVSNTAKWTKNYVINPTDVTKSKYTIRTIDNKEYLFLEWKNGDYTFRDKETPSWLVFERRALNQQQKQAVLDEGKKLHVDNTDIPFEDAPDMIGTWKAVATVDGINEFEGRNYKYGIYSEGAIDQIVIKEDGKMEVILRGGRSNSSNFGWSGHRLINREMETVSECTIEERDGKTYMFYQYKNGDYVYRDETPIYYVLEKQ